jgi:2,3,4,5-tetrahydropyridine-2-carboxylate N-succinyltransferase
MPSFDLSPVRTMIEDAWERRDTLSPKSEEPAVRDAVDLALDALDKGALRAAEPSATAPTGWVVNAWAKKAILLSFRLYPNRVIGAGIGGGARSFDKLPLKTANWEEQDFVEAGFRAVPPTSIRRGAYVAPGAVVMPSYINVGGYVGKGTMVDTWVTIGSCAQIGANCHVSGGVGIGGVLEPLQAAPVIIEDGVFLGSRCVVVEGVHIEAEAVIGAGVVLTASTEVLDITGPLPRRIRGRIPRRSVVIPGTRPRKFPAGEFQISCALIIGERSESTDRKTSLNEVLREHGIPI